MTCPHKAPSTPIDRVQVSWSVGLSIQSLVCQTPKCPQKPAILLPSYTLMFVAMPQLRRRSRPLLSVAPAPRRWLAAPSQASPTTAPPTSTPHASCFRPVMLNPGLGWLSGFPPKGSPSLTGWISPSAAVRLGLATAVGFVRDSFHAGGADRTARRPIRKLLSALRMQSSLPKWILPFLRTNMTGASGGPIWMSPLADMT